MRIIIDAYQMRSAITGTDRQARNVLRELQLLDHDNEYLVIVNRDEPFVSEVVTAPNFKLMPTKFRKRASWIFLGLPLLLLRRRADVFFSFHNLTAPGLPVCKSVVSVLDLIPFMYQKRYYAGWKNYWLRRLIVLGYMRNAAKTGQAFWAVSEYTKQTLCRYFGIPERKVQVGYLQADPAFAETPAADQVAAVKHKYGIGDEFFYAIQGAEPRKNNLLVIEAHRRLPQEIRAKFPLVVAGGAWQGEELPKVDDSYIILPGYVSDDEHRLLFHAATAFVGMSSYEGFGLPWLEAMAAGTPVISSNATSLPEVVGEAAITLEPDDQAGLTQALLLLATNPKERIRMTQAGLDRVKLFSWKKTAEVIHALIVGANAA